MEKFDHLKHQDFLITALEADLGHPYPFWMNPLWLSKGPFFINDLEDGHFTIVKQTKIYGHEVKYHLGPPIATHEDVSPASSREEFRALWESGEEFLLADSQFNNLMEIPKTKPDFQEYVYDWGDYGYGDLRGGEWKSWRQSLKKTDELLEVKYFHNKCPLFLRNQMESLLKEWASHREKHIGKHHTWYVRHASELKNHMIMAFYLNGRLISFNISQRIGPQIFFLDEKTLRGVLPNSFTLAKAYHYLCFKFWMEESDSIHLMMSSGLGEPEYKLGDKTFDLDRHKQLLKPSRMMKLFKVKK